MISNVKNWKYKSRAELEALTDAELKSLARGLYEATRFMVNANINRTDEMVWLLLVLPEVLKQRNIEL